MTNSKVRNSDKDIPKKPKQAKPSESEEVTYQMKDHPVTFIVCNHQIYCKPPYYL